MPRQCTWMCFFHVQEVCVFCLIFVAYSSSHPLSAVPPMLRTLLPDVSTETIRACLGVCLGNQVFKCQIFLLFSKKCLILLQEGVVEMLQTQDYSVEHVFYTTCSGDPTQEAFLIHLAQYMHRRLLVLTDFCIVCDSKHAMSTTKLLPCSKELCTSR